MRTLQAAWALAQKDLRSIIRDRTALVLTILVPIALVTVFGWIMAYAFGGGSGGMPKVSLHVADFSNSPRSAAFVDALSSLDMVRIKPVELSGETLEDPETSAKQLQQLILDGDAHHILVLPASLEEDLAAGDAPQLEMVRDPRRDMEDQIIQLAIMQATIAEAGGSVFTGAVNRMLADQGMDETSLKLIDTWMTDIGTTIEDYFDEPDPSTEDAANEIAEQSQESQDVTGESEKTTAIESTETVASADESADESSTNPVGFDGMFEFMREVVPLETTDVSPPNKSRQVTYQQAQSVAGMTVMMLLFALTSCGSVLLTEREEGTLKRLFAQPISRTTVLLGKFLFVFVVGMVQMSILFLYGEFMFKVGLFRDPVTLFVLSVTWVCAGGAFGMFLAAVSRSTKQAESLASLLILVMAALGGCWFPLQLMSLPPVLETVCKSTMTYWAMTGFQGMLWNQLPWTADKTLIALGWQWGWTVLFTGLAVFFFKRNFCRG